MWFDFLILPLLIFLARICDVSIGTIRIIYIARGNKLVAPLLGFFEVLIWILAISRIMHHLDNWICYVAYAAGFATGNFFGLLLEEKMAKGIRGFRIITGNLKTPLIDALKKNGFGVTSVEALGAEGKVLIVYTIVQRQYVDDIVKLINRRPNVKTSKCRRFLCTT